MGTGGNLLDGTWKQSYSMFQTMKRVNATLFLLETKPPDRVLCFVKLAMYFGYFSLVLVWFLGLCYFYPKPMSKYVLLPLEPKKLKSLKASLIFWNYTTQDKSRMQHLMARTRVARSDISDVADNWFWLIVKVGRQ